MNKISRQRQGDGVVKGVVKRDSEGAEEGEKRVERVERGMKAVEGGADTRKR